MQAVEFTLERYGIGECGPPSPLIWLQASTPSRTTCGERYLSQQGTVEANTGTAVVVQPPAVAALLVGIQVHPSGLAGGASDEVQPLVQLSQLQNLAPSFYHVRHYF